MRVTEESLWAGIEQMEGQPAHDIGLAVQTVAEGPGSPWCASTSATPSGPPCTRIRRSPTTGRADRGPVLKTGMVFAIEPMVNAGGSGDGHCSTTGGAS
jgi:methionyl aminopeptidase